MYLESVRDIIAARITMHANEIFDYTPDSTAPRSSKRLRDLAGSSKEVYKKARQETVATTVEMKAYTPGVLNSGCQ